MASGKRWFALSLVPPVLAVLGLAALSGVDKAPADKSATGAASERSASGTGGQSRQASDGPTNQGKEQVAANDDFVPVPASSKGACCLDNGACRFVTKKRCEDPADQGGLEGFFWGAGVPCPAAQIQPDIDCWPTAECHPQNAPGSQFDLCTLCDGNPAIQTLFENFFPSGSGICQVLMELGGQQGQVYDTRVRRLETLDLPNVGAQDTTMIRVEYLKLVSCRPIQAPDPWNVRAELSQPRVELRAGLNLPIADCNGKADVFTESVMTLSNDPGPCGSRYTLVVELLLTHDRIGDLYATLEHTDIGNNTKQIVLMSRPGFAETSPLCTAGEPGGVNGPGMIVTFVDGGPPIEGFAGNGAYSPDEPLASFYDGNPTLDLCGTWTLRVHDGRANGVGGTLDGWALHFIPPEQPATPMTVRKTHCNGGTFNSDLAIYPRFTFTNDLGQTRILDIGLIGDVEPMELPGADAVPWVHRPFVPFQQGQNTAEPPLCPLADGALPAAQKNFFPGLRLGDPDFGGFTTPACPFAVTHGGRLCVGHCHKVAVHQVVGGCSGACCLPDFRCQEVTADLQSNPNGPPTVVRSARQKCQEDLGGTYLGDQLTCVDNDHDGLADVFETGRPLHCCVDAPGPCNAGTHAPMDGQPIGSCPPGGIWDTDGDGACDYYEAAVAGSSPCVADPWLDCNGNGVADATEVYYYHLACEDPGAAVPDCCRGTANDCNDNGIPDECDIADNTSDDCNGNGVPDECEVAPLCENPNPGPGHFTCNTCLDCNGNGVPDDCDIADQTSDDCNTNNIPDECEIPPLCNLPGNVCAANPGYCCFDPLQPGGVECKVVPDAQCCQNGAFMPGNLNCPAGPVGACCRLNGTCFLTSQGCCQDLGHTWMGGACTPNPCPPPP